MVFDPQEKQRWTLGLEWRRFLLPHNKPPHPTYFDWLDYLVDGELLSHKLVIKPGVTPEFHCNANGYGPALGCVSVFQQYSGKFCKDAESTYHRGMLLFQNPRNPFGPRYRGGGNGRTPIFICHCGDYGCGAIFCRVDRIDSRTVVWHDFRHESDSGSVIDGTWVSDEYSFELEWADIGPYFFDYEQYIECLMSPPPKPQELD